MTASSSDNDRHTGGGLYKRWDQKFFVSKTMIFVTIMMVGHKQTRLFMVFYVLHAPVHTYIITESAITGII